MAMHRLTFFLRRQFQWPETHDDPRFAAEWYTIYMSVVDAISVLVLFVMLPVMTNVLRLHDTVCASLASVSYIIYMAIFALVPDRSLLYTGAFFQAFSFIFATPLRSLLSKMVDDTDVGKAS